MCEVRGTTIISPHGIPSDLLDRTLIVQTLSYSENEIAQILKARSEVEGVKLNDAALMKLARVGFETSLRYAMQLISVCGTIARAEDTEIEEKKVDEACSLFLDTKRAGHEILEMIFTVKSTQ